VRIGRRPQACNASVSAGQNQPYWIDISVPHGATNSPSGTYTAIISITADQGTATIPVTLNAWNFELPEQPSELSEWTLWNPASGNTTTTLDQALMSNKVMGRYDVAANSASDMTSFGLNRSGLDGYYFIGIQCNGSYSGLPSTSQINTAAANFPAGLGLDFYVADELNGCSGAYSALKTMGTNAHAANRSVKTLMTTNAPDSNLFTRAMGGVLSTIGCCLMPCNSGQACRIPAAATCGAMQAATRVRQHPCMDGGLSADQRTHPSRVLELDARRHGTSVLASRRMDRRKPPSAVGTMWIPQVVAAAWVDRAMASSSIRRPRSPLASPLRGYG